MKSVLLIAIALLAGPAYAGDANCTGLTNYSQAGFYSLNSSHCVVRSTVPLTGFGHVRWTLPSNPSDGDEFTGQDGSEPYCEEYEGQLYCWTGGVDLYSANGDIDGGSYLISWDRTGWEMKLQFWTGLGWIVVTNGCYVPGC